MVSMVLVLFHAAAALTWASQPPWTGRLTVRQPHSLQPGEEDGAADQSAKLDEERTGNCTVALPKKFTGLQSARTWPSRRPAAPPELENITHAKDGFFAPAESLPVTTLSSAIMHSQQPDACSKAKFLLVEDESEGAGLGWTAHLMTLALSIAMREGRVMIEVQTKQPRWCTRAPYTMQCFYEPWTPCATPPQKGVDNATKWQPDGSHSEAQLATLALSRFATEGFWWGTGNVISAELNAALTQHLFTARPWLQEIAGCYMAECQITAGSFVDVHVRDSPEKREERGDAATLDEYATAMQQELEESHATTVHLQTANPRLLDRFVRIASEHNVTLCYTDNERSVSDVWGGRVDDDSLKIREAVTGAVNALIGSQAESFISPESSAWTWFIMNMMPGDERPEVNESSKDLRTLRPVCKWRRRRRGRGCPKQRERLRNASRSSGE